MCLLQQRLRLFWSYWFQMRVATAGAVRNSSATWAILRFCDVSAIIAIVIGLFALPLHLWRLLYPSSDWATLFLLPLAFCLFYVSFSLTLSVFKERLKVMVRASSPLAARLTGRFRAGFVASLFLVVALPTLAWQALTVSPREFSCLAALCLFAGYLSIRIQAWLRFHLTDIFARYLGMMFGAVVAALVFIPVLTWINYWSFVSHSGEFRTATFSDAIALGMRELPARRSFVAEMLAPFFAVEAIKLLLAAQFNSLRWITIIFSIHSALVCFVVAHACVMLTDFAQQMIKRPNR